MEKQLDLAKELTRLLQEHGVLTASIIVDAARDEDSILHPFFEWDDRIAAEKHREEQARLLTRKVGFVCQDGTPEPARHMRFSRKGFQEGEPRLQDGYYPQSFTTSRESFYRIARDELLRDLRGLQESLKELNDAARDAGIIDHDQELLDNALKYLRDLERKLR